MSYIGRDILLSNGSNVLFHTLVGALAEKTRSSLVGGLLYEEFMWKR